MAKKATGSSATRSYHAFVREARAKHGLTLKEARATYQNTKERLGRAPRAIDLTRHPRITKQEAQKAQKEIAKTEAAQKRLDRLRDKISGRKPEKPPKREAPPKGAPPAKAAKPFANLVAYTTWFDETDYEDYYYEEADGTVDY